MHSNAVLAEGTTTSYDSQTSKRGTTKGTGVSTPTCCELGQACGKSRSTYKATGKAKHPRCVSMSVVFPKCPSAASSTPYTCTGLSWQYLNPPLGVW
eukprot:gene16035-biopygen3737